MPLRFCGCPGCPACTPGRTHTYDRDSSPGHQRCAPCQAVADRQHEHRRGTTTQRGYGSTHQAKRKQLADAFTPGQPCARCGQPIASLDDADLGHADDGQGYRGLEHALCNRAAGGRHSPRRGSRGQRTAAAPPATAPAQRAQHDDEPPDYDDLPIA